MSGPLSNLKKSRKAPFNLNNSSDNENHRGRNVPFRHPNYTEGESSFLSEINRKPGKSTELSTSIMSSNSKSTGGGAAVGLGGDFELMEKLMRRLGELEQYCTKQKVIINDKDKRINVLEEKIKLLNKSKEYQEELRSEEDRRVYELERQCSSLKQQIQDMEAFLADYGMIWVGGEREDENVEEQESSGSFTERGGLWEQTSSIPANSAINYDLILKNIRELNEIVDESRKIERTPDGAKFVSQDPIPLTLYANGILMFNGPFRPMEEPSTQRCLKDLSDGYFPSELQKRYPDGVPLSVQDKRDVVFNDKKSVVFTGLGQTIAGKVVGETNIEPEQTNTNNKITTESSTNDRKLTVDQFLNKLPQSVIKDGKVIDIRNSVGKSLKQGGETQPNKVKIIETTVVSEMKDRLKVSEENRPPSSRYVTTLRIKDDNQEYILKMKYTDRVSDVRRYLDAQRPKESPNYEIMSAFPRKTLKNSSLTLEECGLIPNATLHLSVRK
ncbi:DgyrCDS3754 [Dimorphilus gyrociliatus]|uniref:UBX domain-containing protein 11 n=1 Tax=Dimorphilus gyrociliatus TaxID=2664684 RepID=A0A7I8VH23_9ANNE|nr:DgyrCDS3754 [Dimorphilus gyrociliatus]